VEEKNRQRATRHDELINYEVDLRASSWGEVEEKIFSAFAESDELAPWEMELKPQAAAGTGPRTRVEMRINQRIEAFVNPPEKKERHTVSKRAMVRIAAGVGIAAFAIGAVLFGYFFIFERIPSCICLAWGSDRGLVGNSLLHSTQYASRPGGALRLVNAHGYVQLQNGANLDIRELTRHRARYAISLLREKATGFAGGSASFFVTRHRADESFVVITPDYELEAMGTCFRCLPGMRGKVTTQVLEGVVIVNFAGRDTVYIKAGQSLGFDFAEQRYRVEEGGPVAAYADLAPPPDIKALAFTHELSLDAGQPRCDVTVDNYYEGTTPMRLLISSGLHRVVMSKEGCRAVDTLVDCTRPPGTDVMVAIAKDLAGPADSAVRAAAATRPRNSATDLTAVIPADGAVPSGRAAEELLARAMGAESADAAAAIRLYEYLGTASTSPRVKQTALYAIGRLQALQGREAEKAADSFLRYLALYPLGLFSPEVLFSLAGITAQSEPNKALNYYLSFLDKYPLHSRVSEVLRRAGMIYAQGKHYDEAIALLKQALATMTENDSRATGEMYNAIVQTLIAKGDQNGARIFKEAYGGS
jgi:TolA-binding protein